MTKEDILKYYDVSANGEVFSKRLNRTLLGKVDRYGYRVYCISLDGGVKHTTAHRIVAVCYIPNTDNHPHINHKDGNKLNNTVLNLEWCSIQYNNQHAFDNGLKTAWNKGKTGVYSDAQIERMKDVQTTSKEVLVVKDDNVLGSYRSIRDLCKQYGFDRRTAQRVLNGDKSYNTINGYKLIYS